MIDWVQDLKKIMQNFLDNLNGQICSNAKSSAEIKGSKRFFQNEKVEAEPILDSHLLSIKQRLKNHDDKIFLNIQDTTSLNFHQHQSRKSDLGHIGSSPNRNDSFGYWVHNSLLVDSKGNAQGLTFQKAWSRQNFNKDVPKNTRRSMSRRQAIEDKESYRWIEGIERCKDLAHEARIVQVTDREGDIFEFFSMCYSNNQGFVVRSKHNRKIVPVDDAQQSPIEIKSFLETLPYKANKLIKVDGNSKRKAYSYDVDITWAKIKVLVPGRNKSTLRDKEDYSPFETNVIYIKPREEGHQSWILFTSEKIDSAEDALKIIEYYETRWMIEIFHKTLKSVCKIEDSQCSNLESLSPFLAMKSILSSHIMHLKQIQISDPERPADKIFSESEYTVLLMLLWKKEKRPKNPPPTVEMIRRIAQYGGFSGSRKQYPGVVTLARGWQRVRERVDMFEIMLEENMVRCVP